MNAGFFSVVIYALTRILSPILIQE